MMPIIPPVANPVAACELLTAENRLNISAQTLRLSLRAK
jgi:hypothetical protein